MQYIYQDTIVHTHPETQGAFLVPVVHGLDKTCASVATGHQEFHPVYIGPGNITNTARRAHKAGMQLVAVLPIPKSEVFVFVLRLCVSLIYCYHSIEKTSENCRFSTVLLTIIS